jgi:hypothetical protein
MLTNNAVHWNKDKFVKLTVAENVKGNHGQGKITWESHALSPRTLTWEGKTADITVKADAGSNPTHVSVITNVPEQGKFEVDYHRKVRVISETLQLPFANPTFMKLVFPFYYNCNKGILCL